MWVLVWVLCNIVINNKAPWPEEKSAGDIKVGSLPYERGGDAPQKLELQSSQLMRTTQDSIDEFIIWKWNPLVVVDFRFISLWATAGYLPLSQSRGWDICKFCAARRRGHSRAFDTHAVSYQHITTHRGFYWERKQIGSSVKDRKKLKRFVKACSCFYACNSSLLFKPELQTAKSGAMDVN